MKKVEKALNEEKKKKVSNKNKDGNDENVKKIEVVESKEPPLDQQNVKKILETIKKEITELSQITYFPFPELSNEKK